MINPTQIKALRKLIRHGMVSRAGQLLEKIHPADIAQVLSTLPDSESKLLIAALFRARRIGQTFRELPDDLLTRFLDMISDDELAKLILRQPADDAVYFISFLEEDRKKRIREKIPAGEFAVLDRMLLYPKGSAGSIMTDRFLAMAENTTAENAIAEIRRKGSDIEALLYLYVVDDGGALTGVVSLRNLIFAGPGASLGELMLEHPLSANVREDQETVAATVSKYGFLALPVVDDAGRIVGAITVDDVIDVIHEETDEDFYRMAGLGGADRVFNPVLQSFRKRIVWTLVNLVTAFGASMVVGFFEDSISKVVALATFMPVVAGLGGNSGTQALTVVVRGLAIGELDLAAAFKAVGRQLLIGVLVGAVAGIITAVVVFLWKGNPYLGFVLFLAMLANISVGALAGAAVPLLLRLFKLDPALGSSIIVTAITDSFGFLAFLGLATIMLINAAP
jgi:magnesium transporter